jgi:hypothetical protein
MYDHEENLSGLGIDPITIGAGAGVLAPIIGKIFGGDEEDAAKKQAELLIKQQREATVYNTVAAERTKRTIVTSLVVGGAILASVALLYGSTK